MKFLRVKPKQGASFWFALKGRVEIFGGPCIVGWKVDRLGDCRDWSKAHMISCELLASEKPARKVNEFTCGHTGLEAVEGKCPRCIDTRTGHWMDNVLEVVN